MSSSYWCYRCNRFIRVWRRQDIVICPHCDSGFVEEIDNPSRSVHVDGRHRGFPAAAMYMIGPRPSFDQNPRPARRRSCRNGGDRSPLNPVVMLRGGHAEGTSREGRDNRENRGFELFYDDGAGTGLRPLPPSMSEFLLGSGFDSILEQFNSHVSTNGIGRYQQPPASKAAIDSVPTIEINQNHLALESHCAVCKEPFELGTIAREMPCKHIYHPECILPWLAIRNSCPVCRQELPTDTQNARPTGQSLAMNEEENSGLTIWRLPGGGFAVGRFSEGRRGNDQRELPLVYTEMDGGFANVSEPRRISWSLSSSTRNRGRERGGGLRRMFNNLFNCFRGGVIRPQHSISIRESRPGRSSAFRNSNVDPFPRSRRTWSMDVNVNNGMS